MSKNEFWYIIFSDNIFRKVHFTKKMDVKRVKTIFRGKQALSKKSARGNLNHFASNYYGPIVASAQFHSNVLFPVKVLPVNTFTLCKLWKKVQRMHTFIQVSFERMFLVWRWWPIIIIILTVYVKIPLLVEFFQSFVFLAEHVK